MKIKKVLRIVLGSLGVGLAIGLGSLLAVFVPGCPGPTPMPTPTPTPTPAAPVAIPGGPYQCPADVACQFSGLSSTGQGLSYAWDWGDATTGASGPTPTHVYVKPQKGQSSKPQTRTKDYTLTLTVTDLLARQSANQTRVTVTYIY